MVHKTCSQVLRMHSYRCMGVYSKWARVFMEACEGFLTMPWHAMKPQYRETVLRFMLGAGDARLYPGEGTVGGGSGKCRRQELDLHAPSISRQIKIVAIAGSISLAECPNCNYVLRRQDLLQRHRQVSPWVHFFNPCHQFHLVHGLCIRKQYKIR